jgi:hypothetical protein
MTSRIAKFGRNLSSSLIMIEPLRDPSLSRIVLQCANGEAIATSLGMILKLAINLKFL